MKPGRGGASDRGRWDHDFRQSRLAAGAFDAIAAVRRRIQRYNPLVLANFEEGLG
jgi:hypothetical protein